MGISSAGNTALRMSPELATSDMAPSRVETEVQIQGNSPLTRNRAYGSAPCDRALKTTLKTNV